MSSEIVLKLNVVVLLFSVFVNKHSLEIIAEEVCVGCQVKLEMSRFKNRGVGGRGIKIDIFQSVCSLNLFVFLVSILYGCAHMLNFLQTIDPRPL